MGKKQQKWVNFCNATRCPHQNKFRVAKMVKMQQKWMISGKKIK